MLGVVSDSTIRLTGLKTSRWYPDTLRMVVYEDYATGNVYRFLTTHKFSILENFLSIRDFTSAMRLHFRSDLVGVALVGATPLHLLSQTALPLKSPTGAFIAALRKRGPTPNPAHGSHLTVRTATACRALHNFTEELSNRQEVQ